MASTKAPAQQTQRVTGLQISDTAMGQCLQYVFGHCRCPHTLIYYSNFQVHQQQNSLKKGGKAGSTNWYSVNADFFLGYGPFEGLVSCWESSVWYYATYSSQTFTGSGTGTQFNFTISNNSSDLILVMGVAYSSAYNINYSDYADPFTTNAFNLSGTSYLPLYNAFFPLPNYGNISLSGQPFAYYNDNPTEPTVTVIFPSAVTSPQIIVYYAEVGGNNGLINNQSGKKGGGNLPYQNGGLVFERVLGVGPSGNPLTYPEFSGDGGANIALGASAILPQFNYEVKALFGLGNSSPVSTYNPGAAPGDPGQYIAKTTSGDCNPADIICDLICSGNREPGDVDFVWQHGLGFSSYIPSTVDAYWAYSRFGGILKDEPNLNGTSGGTHTFYRPTTSSGSGGPVPGYVNPANAYDNDPTTFSSGFTNVAIDDLVSETWSGFPAGTVSTNTFLRILSSVPKVVSGGLAELQYSIDGGSSFTTIYSETSQSGQDVSRNEQTDSVLIPSGTSMTDVQVQAIVNFGSGSASQLINEIYLDAVVFSGGGGTGSLGLTNLRNYCMAYNIFISGAIDNQSIAAQILDDLAAVANSAPVFDGAALDFIPYCEVSNYGNGTSYVALSASGPLFNLTSANFLPVKGKAPVEETYDRAKDNFNSIQVGFKDATAQWTDNFIILTDSMDVTIQGAMNSTQRNFSYITNAATAQAVGYPLLRRTLLVERKEYKFSLPAVWSTILTPMDLVTLDESTISSYPIPVRIKTLSLDKKMELQVTAEPYIYASSSPIVPGATGTAQAIQNPGNGSNDPGNINTPIILETVPKLIPTGPSIAFCVSGSGAYWGGAIIWMSTDGGNSYAQVAGVTNRQTQGVTSTSTYPNNTDPDSTDSLFVDLTESLGTLNSVSSSQQDQFFPSLCYLQGGGTFTDPNGNIFTIPYELVSFQTATLTAANKYEMGAVTSTPIRRGVFNTPPTSHASGSQFSFLSDGIVVTINLPNNLIGTTLYFKFTSFNIQGGSSQQLQDVSAYTFTPTGQVGWMQGTYTVSPQPTIYQGQSGGWAGVDTNSSTWTTSADIYFPPITTTYSGGSSVKYAARDAGIVAFTNPLGGEQTWVTIYDPGLVGDFGASSLLNTYADLNQTRWNTPGYIRVGTLTSLAFSGGGGSGGGGGTSPGGVNDSIMYIPIVAGTYAANQELFYTIYPRTVTFPVNLTGTTVGSRVNPTSTVTVTLNKNGSSIGTISITSAGVATITFTAAVSFNGISDSFSIVAPSSSDSAFAGFFMAIYASRSN
jgi:hypothetical protein